MACACALEQQTKSKDYLGLNCRSEPMDPCPFQPIEERILELVDNEPLIVDESNLKTIVLNSKSSFLLACLIYLERDATVPFSFLKMMMAVIESPGTQMEFELFCWCSHWFVPTTTVQRECTMFDFIDYFNQHLDRRCQANLAGRGVLVPVSTGIIVRFGAVVDHEDGQVAEYRRVVCSDCSQK